MGEGWRGMLGLAYVSFDKYTRCIKKFPLIAQRRVFIILNKPSWKRTL